MLQTFSISAISGAVEKLSDAFDRQFILYSEISGIPITYGQSLEQLLACIALVLLLVPLSTFWACVCVSYLTFFALTEGKRIVELSIIDE